VRGCQKLVNILRAKGLVLGGSQLAYFCDDHTIKCSVEKFH
jgi:hypothetical protein